MMRSSVSRLVRAGAASGTGLEEGPTRSPRSTPARRVQRTGKDDEDRQTSEAKDKNQLKLVDGDGQKRSTRTLA